jgi:hypothetical protein
MKDQIVQTSPDVKVGETIDGAEHPDPRMRPARLSIRVPALFWARVRRHLERCQSTAERMLWEQWLSPQAIQALLASADSTATHRCGLTGPDPLVPDTAFRHLRNTIYESLAHPLALRLDPEPAGRPGSPAADPTYLLVLNNGATVVMRVPSTNNPPLNEMIPARLDDCFFTRAAADLARPAGDFALPGAPSVWHAPVSAAERLIRDAVVREWVGRYAVATGEGPVKGLIPPDRPCDVKDRADMAPVQFLMPSEWGFNGGASGCIWVGFESSGSYSLASSRPMEASPDSESLRRLLAGHIEEQSNHPESRDRSANSGPYSGARRRRSGYPLTTIAGSCGSNPSKTNSSRRQGPNDALAALPDLTRAMEQYPWAWVQAGDLAGEKTFADSSSSGAAYRSAIALGRCRLLGTAAADLAELRLSPSFGISAAEELAGKLAQWARQAKSLPADVRGATGPRASDLCMGLLEARLEAWAAYLAIDESYSAAVDRTDALAERFSLAIDAALDGLAAFDDSIQWAEPLLASVVTGPGSCLLSNWKKLLADPYRQSLPWWLNCTPHPAMHTAP